MPIIIKKKIFTKLRSRLSDKFLNALTFLCSYHMKKLMISCIFALLIVLTVTEVVENIQKYRNYNPGLR